MLVKEKSYTATQEKTARYAKALGHPVRVFIMDFLIKNTDKCCYSGDMAEELPIARSTLSQHLKELKDAGLIQGEINPPYIKYCIKTLEKLTRDVVSKNGIDATITKVEDIMEIMKYNIMTTPALVIDGEVVTKGRVPSAEEIKQLLTK
ncbi:MAG: MTH895/ArsE family thioredoxin-like protein [Bacteroidia bacterium]|nr:MTH895/ArsE family thioredoxin-like protein [Bacteroidia bacterium]